MIKKAQIAIAVLLLYALAACATVVRIPSTGLAPHPIAAFSNEAILSMALHPNGNYVAVGCESGRVYLIDIQTGKTIATLESDSLHIQSLAFSNDGNYLVTLAHSYNTEDGVASIKLVMWNTNDSTHRLLNSRDLRFKGFGHSGKTWLETSLDNRSSSLKFSNNDLNIYMLLPSNADDDSVSLSSYSIKSGTLSEVNTPAITNQPIYLMEKDGATTILAAGNLWRDDHVSGLQRIKEMDCGTTNQEGKIAYSSVTDALAWWDWHLELGLVKSDLVVTARDIESSKVIQRWRIKNVSPGVHVLGLSPSGEWLASAIDDGILLVNTKERERIVKLNTYGPPSHVIFSADGQSIIAHDREYIYVAHYTQY